MKGTAVVDNTALSLSPWHLMTECVWPDRWLLPRLITVGASGLPFSFLSFFFFNFDTSAAAAGQPESKQGLTSGSQDKKIKTTHRQQRRVSDVAGVAEVQQGRRGLSSCVSMHSFSELPPLTPVYMQLRILNY